MRTHRLKLVKVVKLDPLLKKPCVKKNIGKLLKMTPNFHHFHHIGDDQNEQ